MHLLIMNQHIQTGLESLRTGCVTLQSGNDNRQVVYSVNEVIKSWYQVVS